MTSPLKRIESHPHEAKRLIGIEYDQFLALVALSEQNTYKKQAKLKNIKSELLPKVVDVSEIPKEGVCLCLYI